MAIVLPQMYDKTDGLTAHYGNTTSDLMKWNPADTIGALMNASLNRRQYAGAISETKIRVDDNASCRHFKISPSLHHVKHG